MVSIQYIIPAKVRDDCGIRRSLVSHQCRLSMLRYEGSGEDAIITEWVLGSQQNGGYVGGCFEVLLIHFLQTVMMEKAMDFSYQMENVLTLFLKISL